MKTWIPNAGGALTILLCVAPVAGGEGPITAGASAMGGVSHLAGGFSYAGRTDGLLRLPITQRLGIETGLGLIARDRGPTYERRNTRSSARLRLGDPTRSLWLGVGVERALSGEPRPGTPLLGMGVIAQSKSVLWSASIEQTVERVRIASQALGEPPSDSLAPSVITTYDSRFTSATSAVLSARWERRRLGIETVAGVTINRLTAPRRWWQSAASVALLPRLALLATVGNPAPRWLALDAGLEHRATLGLRLSTLPNPAVSALQGESRLPAWRLRHFGDDRYVLEIHVAGAGQVTIMGDFTEWEPMPLRRLGRGHWARGVRIGPGPHQVQVRLDDGPWQAPAGMPSAADGFNGSVGLFVAE